LLVRKKAQSHRKKVRKIESSLPNTGIETKVAGKKFKKKKDTILQLKEPEGAKHSVKPKRNGR